MRTTLTIDHDNAIRLEKLRRIRNSTFSEVMNDALRRGLDTFEAEAERRKLFKTKVVDLGQPLFANPKQFLADLDEEHDRDLLGLSKS